MSDWSVRARAPLGDPGVPAIIRDPDVLASHLVDAANFPGGHATALVAPASEAEVAAVLSSSARVLPIGAQSSLTGGATPMGETLLSTARLNAIDAIDADCVRLQPGVSLAALDEALKQRGKYYPPAPTFAGAFVGGTVATNAAGAATFKYGTTRRWVKAITVVLATGDVLDLERGAVCAHPDGYFDIELRKTRIRVPVPRYRMPNVPKLSAGYFSGDGMDLIDLFVGSEGTLGVITSVTLNVLPVRPAVCRAFVPFRETSAALDFVRRLRDASIETWATRDPRGLDVSGIEHMDARSLALVREDGVSHANGIDPPADTAIALLVSLELAPDTTAESAFAQISSALDRGAPDTPLSRFCRMLRDVGALDDVALAVPGDDRRAAQLIAVRESVPAAVNRRVARARERDPRIEKTAADMVVPFGALASLLDRYSTEFQDRGLDVAVWGHIGDGNLHPNVIPRSFSDVEAGKDAILALGREAIRLGGAPLAEHGVGRNPVKQQLLRELYGEEGVEEMRTIKRALDPTGKLAPGVLFA